MEHHDLYEKLARYFDQGVIASPQSPHLIEILKILFPPDEAAMAVKLPFTNVPLSQLKDTLPDSAEPLETIFHRMSKRGTVCITRKPGQEPEYRLLPPVVGWYEAPYAFGRNTDVNRKLAPHWIKYRDDAFGREMARGNMPPMRVIPVSRSIKDSTGVLPYEIIRPLLEKQSFCAVTHCSCRGIKQAMDDGCGLSLETCFHFGSTGRYLADEGMARPVALDELPDMLLAAHREGLVHTVDNMAGRLNTICNCCGCCCIFLETKNKLGFHTISTSDYVASVDSEACAACGLCEKRCPMHAVGLFEDSEARVDEARCIGCGVCTPTCPTGAVTLTPRLNAPPLPSMEQFLAARYKPMG